ncbi:MAG TPA: DUF707 domain-containing protein [Methylibium sp.]|uniref:DUF707 domain-containing protein n=1 Tax=Methylibium sp. TaxID=2067992 RepID=UPI002DBE77FD|nr:DUF707 domain-containing protein [Methylibium sp.]HEU4457665.1 DUF707 domain-containing protein [Methylibium sp.]
MIERPTRQLVVLRAGDGSLHREWIADARRDFDLFISYYGDTPGRHQADADFYEHRPGAKWPGIAALLDEHDDWIDGYDAVWFPDDDLSANTGTIDRLFAFFRAHELCLAQPALTRDSPCTWHTLRQDPRALLRHTGFIEVMAPLFSRAALRACRASFKESPSGWGLDWIWPRLCAQAGLSGIAVIDATPVRHTRPPGGELYRRNRELDPRADAARLIARYGLAEVRAVAKYSITRRVAALPLPVHRRLLYWLKRLNGRRKQLAAR